MYNRSPCFRCPDQYRELRHCYKPDYKRLRKSSISNGCRWFPKPLTWVADGLTF